MLFSGRQEGCPGSASEVSMQEGRLGPFLPGEQPLGQRRLLFGTCLLPAMEGVHGGIGEGAEHAGHVLQGRMLLLPFAHGAQRFAFKIDETPVRSPAQNLAQMVVAMAADAGGAALHRRQFVKPAGESVACGQDEMNLILNGVRQVAAACIEVFQGLMGLARKRVGQPQKVGLVQGLRLEGRLPG